jgi:hypothetical protein
MVDARYGDIRCRSAQFSLTMGISPDIGTLVIPVEALPVLPQKADLWLCDGVGQVIFRDLYALMNTVRDLPGGKEVMIQIADRRVLWKWAAINGSYNQPGAGITLLDKSARDLLDLALNACPNVPGVSVDYDVLWWPAVAWDEANPAVAAKELAEDLGMAIYLGPDGWVHVEKVDKVVPWPSGATSEEEVSNSSRLKPEKIEVVGPKIINEETFTGLVAVGMEIDGTIVPIDDLSYKPYVGLGGWSIESFDFPMVSSGTFNGVAYTEEEARELAKKCIYRWYIVKSADWSKLPLLDVRAEVVEVDGQSQRAKPYVIADNASFNGSTWVTLAATADGLGIDFTLDGELGLVKFDEPVYTVTGPGWKATAKAAADVSLRAAYYTSSRYRREISLVGGEAGTQQHQAPELQQWNIEGTPQNDTELNASADTLLDRLKAAYEVPGPQRRTYPGILDIRPSGELRSVQWRVSPGEGALTVLQKHYDEPSLPGVPNADEKWRRRLTWVRLGELESEQRTIHYNTASGGGRL